MLRRREKLCWEGKNPLRIKTLLRRLLLDPGLSTGHSAASAWPISAYYGYQLWCLLRRWLNSPLNEVLKKAHLLSLISDEELKLQRELMALSNLATAAASEQLVVRLEAASLARDQGCSGGKVAAIGDPSSGDKEEEQGDKLLLHGCSLPPPSWNLTSHSGKPPYHPDVPVTVCWSLLLLFAPTSDWHPFGCFPLSAPDSVLGTCLLFQQLTIGGNTFHVACFRKYRQTRGFPSLLWMHQQFYKSLDISCH